MQINESSVLNGFIVLSQRRFVKKNVVDMYIEKKKLVGAETLDLGRGRPSTNICLIASVFFIKSAARVV